VENPHIDRQNIKGEVISPGCAKGELCFLDVNRNVHNPKQVDYSHSTEKEIERFEEKLQSVIKDLQNAADILHRDSFHEEAAIIQTHILMLKDSTFKKQVHDKIRVNRMASESALEHVLGEMVRVFESSEDLIISQKTADIKDIVLRLKRKLLNQEETLFSTAVKEISSPIMVLEELLPSHVMEARVQGIKAFIVNKGTPLSHAAILAKSFGISVLRIENMRELDLKSSEEVLVDAISGELLLRPEKESLKEIEKLDSAIRRAIKKANSIHIWINIVDPQQITTEILKDVEGIGLFRTEFSFMNKPGDFPTEEEQYGTYIELFNKCPDHPITIRTLDIGGDKTLPYFSLGPQENPSLGLRAHRIYNYHPELFTDQIRAILRASVNAKKVRIMYPMIESIDQLLRLKEMMKETLNQLRRKNIPHCENVEQGVLIEVPSSAWGFRDFLNNVDFAGIGTNDLLQYFFAVDRNNANVYWLYQPENPFVLRMLKGFVEDATELNKPLHICGEIASDFWYLPLLVGLGFTDLSVDFHTVAHLKEWLLSLDFYSCRQLAQECLKTVKSTEVRDMLNSFHQSAQPYNKHLIEEDSEAVDPICKMVVHTERNDLRISAEGRTYYFCSPSCMERFLHTKH